MAAEESSADTLRLQFKAMQELQHRRLQKQMEKKKEKELSCKSEVDQEGLVEIPDSLSLLDTEEQNLKNIFEKRVLEDEIQQLRSELRETVDENGRLYKLLKERDFEIKHLKKKIEEDRFAFTGATGMAGDLVATKIVELSKKNRGLTAESESAKARIKQLTNRIQELERELQMAPARPPAKGTTDTEDKPLRTQTGDRALPETPEVKALQDRLAATNLKMSDLRNQIQSTKQELRVAQKVLANEVGDDVNIQQLLASPGTWRGRAQQILVLQSKVRELEKQLGQRQNSELPVNSDPRKLTAQEKNLLRIRSLEKDKQESWEKLASERDTLQTELEELRRKFEGMRSRNKVLSSEVKTLRSQMVTLVEKGRHDDELIDALMDQLKQLQDILGSLSVQEESRRTSQHHLDQKVNSEAQRSNSLVAQLRAMVAEREAKVRQLELEIGQLSVQYLHSKGGGEGASPTHARFPEDQTLITNSPASAGDHVGRLGSSRSVTSLGHTLVESALTRPSLPSPHGTSPRFLDSPEQKGWQAQAAEMKALWQAAEVERDRLNEFVTVLQKRVEESSGKLLEAEQRLQEERQRAVLLEQHLEKMRLEPSRTSVSQKTAKSKPGPPATGAKHNPTGSAKKDSSSTQLSDMPMESQIEELTARLAIQMEENGILRDALGSALRGKEEDFRMYHQTLGQVKGVFLQALRQQKASKQ
ncbi:coiled-coil domain-containing protein 13 isoform X1 [Peromyscus californicus insignis]|uniref:coiled-coil domain-containing protein 13 isoform X1 n=1 Tax=Peromyscus californicus insignis TaxID=564181 RepID=UPI0022A7226F|nr:coiled-coil domain-containing protein 13 isoform X1 [Peromyscus californicus insignis]